MILFADSEGVDQTARMRSLIWAFAIRILPKTRFRMAQPICTCTCILEIISMSSSLFFMILGPIVQSVVSLTGSLRVISLTVLVDSIHNILKCFAEKMWVAFALTFFSAKYFSIFAYHSM